MWIELLKTNGFSLYMRAMVDNLTREQRSYCMSRVKSKDTGIEKLVRSELHKRGWRFRKNVKELPGKPDIVFPSVRVAVFLDGDFWHGYRFKQWQHKIPRFWREKIGRNRLRDRNNRRALRQMGWKVIRLWQNQIKKNFDKCIQLVVCAIEEQRQ